MLLSGLTGLQSGAAYSAGPSSLSNYASPQSAHAFDRVSASASSAAYDVHEERQIPYGIIDESHSGDPDFIPQRPRRDTLPLWTLPPYASIAHPPSAPPVSASKTFVKPQLNAIHGRAQSVLVKAYSNIFGCTMREAEAILRRIDANLYKEWRNISRIGDIDWRPGEQPDSLYSMAYGAGAFASRLKQAPHLSDNDTLALATFHLSTPATFVPDDDNRYDLYQGVLERGLHWINPDKARIRKLSAADILQLVYHHRRPALGSRSALTQVLQRERHVLIDEAALIFLYTQTDLADIDPAIRIDAARRQYANALAREWLDASLQLRLLPSSPAALDCYAFWFDGISIPNSYRKSLEQIVSEAFAHPPRAREGETLEKIKHNAGLSRHLFGQPEYPITRANWEELVLSVGGKPAERYHYHYREGTINIDGWRIDRDELYSLFERAMHSLGLDTIYPAGTPQYEMAALLRQMGFAHRVVLEDFNHPAKLIAAFNELQDAWRHHPRSPVSPAFLAGLNLARRNNVFLFNTQSELGREQQALEQAYRDVVPALTEAGIDGKADMQYWHQVLDSGKPLFEILSELAASPMGERISIYKHAQKKADALLAAPETIAYSSTDDLVTRIHEYFHQHLMAYAEPPAFDETREIAGILREKLAMTEEDLLMPRRVRLGPPTSNSSPMQMLPVDEFLTRRQLYAAMMRHGDNVIAAADEWNKAQIAAARKIARHPVVIAKAKDLLRRRGQPYTDTDIDILAEAQASNIVDPSKPIAPQPRPLALEGWHAFLDRLFRSPTLTAIVNAFASGDPLEIAGLFPFVLPIYEIVQGMQKEDWDLALKGVIQLGTDALFTLAGAGLEAGMARSVARATEAMQLARAATPLTERIGVDSLLDIGRLIPEFAETQFGGLPRTVHRDAFQVHAAGSGAARQTRPKAVEAAARRVPGSPDLQIHHLDVEGESVIATSSVPGYSEVNHRGEPVPGAPPIFADPNSGEHIRLTKEFGLPEGVAGVTEAQLAARISISSIARYWSTIDLVAARIPSPAPLDIIRSLVQHNAHPQHAVLEKLLMDAYTRSETARTIINDAYSRAPYDRRPCVVTYDAPRAHQYGARVYFMSNEALFRSFYTGPIGDVAFQMEREMLHEMVHFLTGLEDPLMHEAHNNRGATTAMVQKILGEILDKPPFPPRLCYRKQGTFDLVHHSDNSVDTNNMILRQLHDWSIAEDRYLDRILDQGREYPATLYTMGQKITQRATVRQGLKLAAHLSLKARKLSTGSIAKIIPVILDAFELPSEHYRTVLKNFLMHSKTFQRLAAAWQDKSWHTPVKIALMPDDASLSRHARRKRVSHITSLAGDRIWLNRNPLYYFSIADTTPMSDERVLLDALLDLFVNGIVPGMEEIPLNKSADRGVSVLLSNAIMRQMAKSKPLVTPEPDRICLALTENEHSYLPDASDLSRALTAEDQFLFRFSKGTRLSQAEEEEAELRRCAAGQGPRYSLFSCIGAGSDDH